MSPEGQALLPRCADWSCDPANAYLSAIGLNSGSVMLCNFGGHDGGGSDSEGEYGNRNAQPLVRCVIENPRRSQFKISGLLYFPSESFTATLGCF